LASVAPKAVWQLGLNPLGSLLVFLRPLLADLGRGWGKWKKVRGRGRGKGNGG